MCALSRHDGAATPRTPRLLRPARKQNREVHIPLPHLSHDKQMFLRTGWLLLPVERDSERASPFASPQFCGKIRETAAGGTTACRRVTVEHLDSRSDDKPLSRIIRLHAASPAGPQQRQRRTDRKSRSASAGVEAQPPFTAYPSRKSEANRKNTTSSGHPEITGKQPAFRTLPAVRAPRLRMQILPSDPFSELLSACTTGNGVAEPPHSPRKIRSITTRRHHRAQSVLPRIRPAAVCRSPPPRAAAGLRGSPRSAPHSGRVYERTPDRTETSVPLPQKCPQFLLRALIEQRMNVSGQR